MELMIQEAGVLNPGGVLESPGKIKKHQCAGPTRGESESVLIC